MKTKTTNVEMITVSSIFDPIGLEIPNNIILFFVINIILFFYIYYTCTILCYLNNWFTYVYELV